MISHITLGTNDFATASQFYTRLMAHLGWRKVVEDAVDGKERPRTRDSNQTQNALTCFLWLIKPRRLH